MEPTPTSHPSEIAPPPREPRLPRLRQWAGRLMGHSEIAVQGSEPESEAFALEQLPAPVDIAEELPEEDSYEEEMEAWTHTISTSMEDLKTAAAENGAAVQKSWSLIGKVAQGYRMGYDWADDGNLVRKGIDKRYGSQGQLRRREEELSKQLLRRRRQLDYATNFNSVLEFADEIDASVYRRFIPQPGQLGEEFSLPKTDQPPKDAEEAAELLNTLPFVDWSDVKHVRTRKHPKIVIDGHFDFPAERVIGVASFDSWAGRGEDVRGPFGMQRTVPNGKGGKSFTPSVLMDVENSSRGAITDYAHMDPAKLKEIGGNAEMVIVQDADGEYWGIATSEGSHRTAAAKLRGDKTVAVSKIEIASEEDMPKVGYSIKERFSPQAKDIAESGGDAQ